MKLQDDQWDLGHLRSHLQAAADLEAWTIPYYMAAMFSIVDRSSPAYQLVQSVVHQEMLHLQLVANVANAYGYSPIFGPDTFEYVGTAIPMQLWASYGQRKDQFGLQNFLGATYGIGAPATTSKDQAFQLGGGPLDEQRINGMCLVEYPEWDTGGKPVLRVDVTEYGSIGEFYDAVEYGARQLASDIVGGVNQVDMFSAFYRNLPTMTVQSSGAGAFAQVALLIDVIRDQGEAAKAADEIDLAFQNTADDSDPQLSHYEKFSRICGEDLPPTYPVKDPSDYGPDDHKRLAILLENFGRFERVLGELFAGRNPGDFAALMVTIGANILACWKCGVTPRFT